MYYNRGCTALGFDRDCYRLYPKSNLAFYKTRLWVFPTSAIILGLIIDLIMVNGYVWYIYNFSVYLYFNNYVITRIRLISFKLTTKKQVCKIPRKGINIMLTKSAPNHAPNKSEA